jgi:peptidyl-prolyl cis-trans isomerase SurA
VASEHIAARTFRALFPLFLSGAFLAGCSPKEQDPIVARIGERSVPLSEYERIYLKSSGTREQAAASSIEEREKLLDLIVRYKLKLEDAYAQGLQKRPEVIQEIEQYKGSLAQSFLVEREVVRAGVRQLFDRRQEEVRVSHILLELSPSASPAESAAAYAGAYEIID